ncbi:MAG: DsrE family protein [Burkholderiales bacterium]
MTATLMILNDPPYGTERSYNALRLARSLLDKGTTGVKLFLMGDAAACAHGGQKVPPGYYNIADMLGGVIRRGGTVSVCGSCMDARGITADELVSGAERGSMDVLSTWTADADKVIVF